jgi:hypothetical protein
MTGIVSMMERGADDFVPNTLSLIQLASSDIPEERSWTFEFLPLSAYISYELLHRHMLSAHAERHHVSEEQCVCSVGFKVPGA